MKFKIKRGTRLFAALMAIRQQWVEAETRAEILQKDVGADDRRGIAGFFGGGISGFYFVRPPRTKNWVRFRHYPHWFYPRSGKANRELLEKMKALPTVSYDPINSLLNFCPDYIRSRAPGCTRWEAAPQLLWRTQYILLEIADEMFDYDPPGDLIQITDGEFSILKNSVL